MLFTIGTIIFGRLHHVNLTGSLVLIETNQLPLSFFTSYFGQNISDVTGDEKNPTSEELWRYGGMMTTVIPLISLFETYNEISF